ncbi:MAG: translation initiation factor IF-2 [Puniceicoccales bacterium]|jgi:translation initiation factor IF-2|nr:translation initiation factor IF-2 [Puniceicoccales bacterium]
MPPHLPPLPPRAYKSPAPLPPPKLHPSPEKKGIESGKPLKLLKIRVPIIVHEFALAIGLKPFQLISELMHIGLFVSMNQSIAEDVAVTMAQKYGFQLEIRRRGEEGDVRQAEKKEKSPAVDISAKRETRPPIVCVLGHVDHGKTTLLDAIRQANVASGEAGGITQHIAAYQVEVQGKKITFLDTPGHAAFANMRQRGADVTDIAILVVAADDGFMPQTDEALKCAQKAGVPVVVAINKVDLKSANVERVKQQMQQRGIAPEDWGGETLCLGISAAQKTHIQELLELLLLQAEMLELKANPKAKAEAVIIESQIDPGCGAVATAIVREGTLSVGTALVCGSQYGRVRSLFDDHGQAIRSASPSTPVRITGWSALPEVGSIARAEKDEKRARQAAEESALVEKQSREEVSAAAHGKSRQDALASLGTESQEKVLRILIKADVQGSLEAVNLCLATIRSNKVRLEVLDQSVGHIGKNDVERAHSSGATLLGFNVAYDSGAGALVKNLGVPVIRHEIIYELVEQVRGAMVGLLEPEWSENYLGSAQVRQVFQFSKYVVAGCMVTDGRILRDKPLRIQRGRETIFEGRMASLKHLKEDLAELRAGLECGIQVQGFSAFEIHDEIKCYELVERRPSL